MRNAQPFRMGGEKFIMLRKLLARWNRFNQTKQRERLEPLSLFEIASVRLWDYLRRIRLTKANPPKPSKANAEGSGIAFSVTSPNSVPILISST